MSEIIFDLGREISEKDIMNLRERLKVLKPGDEITICMEAADAHEADKIVEELEGQGFDYQPHGGHGEEYYLIARKKQ